MNKTFVSGKKNVCPFEVMTKASVSPDKNVPLQKTCFCPKRPARTCYL